MDLKETFKNYIKNLKQEDNIHVYYHAYCADGLCSAVITTKAIERIQNLKIKNIIAHKFYEVTPELIKQVKENKAKKVIFADLSIDAKPEMIKQLEKEAEILIIDHHQYENSLESEKTIFLHASKIKQEIDSSKYPASKLTYDLFSELTNIEDLDWLSAIGLISDMGYNTWKQFVKNIVKKYKFTENEDIMKTDIGKAKALLSTAMMFPRSDNGTILHTVYNYKEPNELLNNNEFRRLQKQVTEEMNHWIKKLNTAETHGNLIIYEIKPKIYISSTLSTVLSIEYLQKKTLILISDMEDQEKLVINSRDQSMKTNMNELLKEATKGLKEATAGGHIPAAGAKIKREDLKQFKENIIKLYEKYSKQTN